MTVTLTGTSLTLEEVARVARTGEGVELAPRSLERMAAARAVAEKVVAGGGTAYGLTTGLGIRRDSAITRPDHDRLVLRQHLIGHGPAAPRDVVRAMAAAARERARARRRPSPGP